MTVYVDDAFIEATVPNGRAVHSSRWCHLMADSEAELHQFAAALGLRRSYYQDHGAHPHYDVTEGKRWQAIRLGAQEVSWREAPGISSRMAGGTPAAAPPRPAPERSAEDVDRLAGEHWRAGDLIGAATVIAVGRVAFPGQADLWDRRTAQIRAGMDRRAAAPAPEAER